MTSIYLLRSPNGIETNTWLCPTCLRTRRRKGWEVVTKKPPPHELDCNDCPKAKET